MEFYRKAKGAGINPIIGYEAYIAPGSRFDKGGASSSKAASYHLTLLAQNRTGFQNLVKLASAASLEGFYFKPRIDKEILEKLQRRNHLFVGLRQQRIQPRGDERDRYGRSRKRSPRYRRLVPSTCSAIVTSSRS